MTARANRLDETYGVSKKITSLDQQLGVSNAAAAASKGLSSFFGGVSKAFSKETKSTAAPAGAPASAAPTAAPAAAAPAAKLAAAELAAADGVAAAALGAEAEVAVGLPVVPLASATPPVPPAAAAVAAADPAAQL